MPRSLRQRILTFVLCAFAASTLFAQNNSGRISGAVTDSSGAVIPGAAVLITNESTKLSTKAVTDRAGFYVAVDLPVGSYDVTVIAPGFKKTEKTGYDLVDQGHITADFKLDIGVVTDSVVITAPVGETVNTVSGELGNTVDAQQIDNLALNGNNYLQLVSLIPGVALLDEDQMATTTSLSVTTWAANGGRPGANHLMIDGGNNLDSGSNGSQVNNVGVSFVQQVRIQTAGMSAEYGRNSGASINAVTKSGGNTFHGGANFTIRNDALDAKDYFAPFKPVLRYDDFSYNVGGPIYAPRFGLAKGKLFFFAGEEWKRIRKFTSPTRVTLPTLAEIGGDFSDRTNVLRFPGTTTPIPGNKITSLMTPDGRAVMAVYAAMIKKAALYTNTPISNNATFQVLNPFNWRQDIVRVDYHPIDNNSVYFRWLHDNYNLVDPFGTFNSSALPNTPTARNRPGYGPQLGDLWTIRPNLLNEARLNVSWNGQRTPLQGADWQRSTFDFQYPRVYGGNGVYGTGIPNVSISGFTGYNGPATVYLISPTTDISASDGLTWIRGEHELKVGVDIIRNRKDQNARTNYNGAVSFNTSPNTNTTGFSLADAALGNFSTYSEASSDPLGFFRFSQYEAYVQDNWRATRRLTLYVGLRFSHFTPTYTSGNNIVNFDPSKYDPSKAVTVTTGGLVVAGSGNPYNGLIRAGDGIPSDQVGRVPAASTSAINLVPAGAPRGLYPAYNLFMPRFGFAYALTADGKTSIRGGFGAFHDRVQGNLIFSQLALAPFASSIAVESGNLANPGGGTASAQGVMGGISAIDSHLKVPLVDNYDLSLERSLPWGSFLRIAYAGSISRHLLRQPDINFPTFAQFVANNALPSAGRPSTNYLRPYKGYSSIRMYISDANANYNSLQAFFSKRKGNQSVTVSYTWSHALADASSDGDNPDNGIEYTNRHFFYGPTSFDRRQVFVATYTYRLPIFEHRRDFLNKALGGWDFSGITRAQTGPQLTAVGNNTIGANRRADYIGGDVTLPTDQRGPNHWFNTAAFATAQPSALGTAGVGTIVGPGLYLWDMSLRKELRFRESRSIQFRADGFNVMNHANFRSLQTTTTSSNFGTVTGSGPARNIQGEIRISF